MELLGFDLSTLITWGGILLLMRLTLPKIFMSIRPKPAQPISGLRILNTVKLQDLEANPKLMEIARQVADLEIKVMTARGQMAQANQSNNLMKIMMGGQA